MQPKVNQEHTGDRLLIAYHEAGHAVVACKLGITTTNITMLPGDGTGAAVHGHNELVAKRDDRDPAALAQRLYANVMVAIAGAAAQSLAGYSGSIHDEAHANDRKSALSYAAPLARIEAGLPALPGPDEPQVLERGDPLHTASVNILARALPETMALLNDNWQAVMHVADALTKRDRLSKAVLDQIFANGQR